MKDYLKISKDCGNKGSKGCFANGVDDEYAFGVITSDGTSIMFVNIFPIGPCWIIVDIDGPNKGANADGKDVFCFIIDTNGKGIFPDGIKEYHGSTEECIKSKNMSCTAWVINNENLDYLKADTDGKCINNNSIILDGTSNITCK